MSRFPTIMDTHNVLMYSTRHWQLFLNNYFLNASRGRIYIRTYTRLISRYCPPPPRSIAAYRLPSSVSNEYIATRDILIYGLFSCDQHRCAVEIETNNRFIFISWKKNKIKPTRAHIFSYIFGDSYVSYIFTLTREKKNSEITTLLLNCPRDASCTDIIYVYY
jgi:hypothetical protein